MNNLKFLKSDEGKKYIHERYECYFHKPLSFYNYEIIRTKLLKTKFTEVDDEFIFSALNYSVKKSVNVKELLKESDDTTDYNHKDEKKTLQTTYKPDIVNMSFKISPKLFFNYINPKSTEREVSMTLDTRFRRFDENFERFRWFYNNYGDITNEFTSTIYPIGLASAIEIGKFYIPKDALPDNYYGHVALTIDEFVGDTIISNGCNYHFLCKATSLTSSRWELEPINSVYKFKVPQVDVRSISISFCDPINTIVFEKDFITLANFLFTSIGSLSSAIPHGLTTGDRIYFQDFNTGNSYGQATYDTMNDDGGLPVTVTGANAFTVPVDLSGVLLSTIEDSGLDFTSLTIEGAVIDDIDVSGVAFGVLAPLFTLIDKTSVQLTAVTISSVDLSAILSSLFDLTTGSINGATGALEGVDLTGMDLISAVFSLGNISAAYLENNVSVPTDVSLLDFSAATFNPGTELIGGTISSLIVGGVDLTDFLNFGIYFGNRRFMFPLKVYKKFSKVDRDNN